MIVPGVVQQWETRGQKVGRQTTGVDVFLAYLGSRGNVS